MTRSHPFIDTDNSTINGAGVDHVLEVVDEKGNPGKADTNDEEENYGYHPGHGPTLIVDLCGHLHTYKYNHENMVN